MINIKIMVSALLIILIQAAIIFPQGTSVIPDARGYIVNLGDQITDFPVKLTDGTEIYLSKFDKKIIALNFFASWCVVCRKEIPHIEKEVWQAFKNRDVLVLGIDYKEDLATTSKFIDEMKITYPVALDTSGVIFSKFAQGGVTRNIVLDENLKIIYLTRLFNEQEFKGMIEIIKSSLDVKKHEHEKELKPMKQVQLVDLAGSGKTVNLFYHGKHDPHLEGKIFVAKKKNLEIGISIFPEDLISQKYDKKKKSLEIKYKHFTGMRIAILPMIKITVPADIETVNIYDHDQKR